MTPEQIVVWEENAARGWPALRTEFHQGWTLRFSDGYTKRANSVHPLGEGAEDWGPRIEAAEAAYRQAGLPPLFKIPVHPRWQGLDEALGLRGYQVDSPSRILSLDLAATGNVAVPEVSVVPEFSESWLQSFFEASGVCPAHQSAARILASRVERPLVGSVWASGRPVAWGYVAVVDDQAWLFDLEVLSQVRRQGWGRALVQALFSRAREAGARTACLQVLGANPAANALYEGMGFTEAYRYHYRKRP